MLAVVPLYNNKHQRKDLWLTSQLRSCSDFGGLTVIGATSRLMLHRYWYCNTEKDVLSGLYLHDQVPQSG